STTDTSAQSEQSSYIIFNEIGIHYNHRRYMHMFVNGIQRSKNPLTATANFIFEDAQQPNGDVVEEWYPDDSDGQLFKIEDWFEFDDAGQGFSNNDADLSRRTILLNGVPTLTIAPYRFMFRRRAVTAGESANDYTHFFSMVNTVTPTGSSTSGFLDPITDVAAVNSKINLEQWMRIIAVQHTIGNWDSYGYERGKNCYSYRGQQGGRFELLTWDIDFTMGIGG